MPSIIKEENREIVRRFDSKANIKNAKKNGIAYDSTKGSGIPTATTNIEPLWPDKIKTLLGAKNADYYIDIDITNKTVLRRKTKQGKHEIVIQQDINSFISTEAQINRYFTAKGKSLVQES